MSLSTRFRAWIHDLRSHPLRNLTRGQRALRYTYDLVVHCGRELRRDRADQMAAALTYRTLFSLLPTLALALVVLQTFVGPAEQEAFKSTVADWVLSPIRATRTAEPALASLPTEVEPGTVATPAQTTPFDANRAEFEQAQLALEARVGLITKELESIDFRSIGLVGLLLFLYAATGLLGTVERSFDIVYAARRRRIWYRRLPIHYTVVTLGPIVILSGLYTQRVFVDLLAAFAWTNWMASLFLWIWPLLSAWLVLFLMFVAIPNVHVHLRAAAAGALVAALVAGASVELFRLYVSKAAVASLYGALALLPLFLLWLYVLWLVVLFGLEVSYALQTVRSRKADSQAVGVIDTSWAVPVAVQVAEAFDRGETCRPDGIGGRLDVSGAAIKPILDALEAAGIVRAVDPVGGYQLARPAGRISMDELFAVAYPEPHFGADDEVPLALGAFVAEVHEAGMRRAQQRTLADFVPSLPPVAAT